jgi:hypothetical protein
MCADDTESQMDMLEDIDNSYESEYDKITYYDGPKLLLCGYSTREYLVPGYPLT